MARLNLVPHPSFTGGTLGWEAVNGATIAGSSQYAFYGSTSLLVTKAAQNGSGTGTNQLIPAAPGLPYAASAYVRLPVTIPAAETAALVLKVQWRTAAGLTISEVSSSVSSVAPSSEWTRLTLLAIAPAGTASVRLTITQLISGTAGQVFYLDAVLFEQSGFVGGYLDSLDQANEDHVVNTALTPLPQTTVGGMQLNADVILNDLVLNTIDEDKTLWVCTDIDGWWGHADPEVPNIPRGVEDGSYDVSGRFGSRILTLTGVFIPSSPAMLPAARDRLVRATNLVRRGAWLRTNEEPTKAAYVRLSGRPTFTTVNARGRTEFTIGLRAADPIKYEWNDGDPDGLTRTFISGADNLGIVNNKGTADVTAVFELTGPLGAGSTVYNSATDETITLINALRGDKPLAAVTFREVYDNIATLTTGQPHKLIVGDRIVISGVGANYDSVNTPYVVLSASDNFPYQFSYAKTAPDETTATAFGSVSLVASDVLAIDTYGGVVALNGNTLGNRSRVETLVDWIKLAPGDNTISFTDNVDRSGASAKSITNNIAEITTTEAHFFVPGEEVVVEFNTTAEPIKKSLTSNVITLTTDGGHEFSVGDLIDVVSTELSTITTKNLSANVATLTTAAPGAFASGDTINVTMPTTRTPVAKSVTSNVATITTSVPHGYSTGDSVAVTLSAAATLTTKALASNVATFGTAAAHAFSTGDSVTIALPTSTTINNKATAGSSVILDTTAAHGFVVGDRVTVALPASAVLSNTRSMAVDPSQRATLTTSAAHGFSVGDRVTIDIGIPPVVTVTNRVATTTTCTLTVSTTHKFAVGEEVLVSGVTTRYNGLHVITAVAATTITYALAGSAESTVASGGSVSNESIRLGYNGSKIVETVPTTTTFTVYAGEQRTVTSSTQVGVSPVLTNQTNSEMNGTYAITSATSTQFTYVK